MREDATPPEQPEPPAAVWHARIAWFIVLSAQLAVCGFLYRFSFFKGDDFLNFQAAGRMSLAEYAFTFRDVHFVPLHYGVSWIMFRTVGAEWTVACAILWAAQLGALFLTYDLARYLVGTRISPLWLLPCATSIYLPFVMAWWTAALHRLPCLFFTVVCLNQSVRWVDRGRWSNYFLAQIATAAALGFFVKGLLLPLYVLGIELCRIVVPPRAGRPGAAVDPRLRVLRSIGVLLPMAAMALAYVAYFDAHVDARHVRVHRSIGEIAQFFRPMVGFTVQGLAFNLIRLESALADLAGAESLMAAVIVFTVLLSPRAAGGWVVGLAWFAAHAAIVASSSRSTAVGALVTWIPRYYFELLLPFALAVVLVRRALADHFDRAKRAISNRASTVLSVVGLGAGAVYAVLGWWHVVHLDHEHFNDFGTSGRAFKRLLRSVSELEAAGEPFGILDSGAILDGNAAFEHFFRFSDVLEILGKSVSFDSPADRLWRIRPDGSLMRVVWTERAEIYASRARVDDGSQSRPTSTTVDENGCLRTDGPRAPWLNLALEAPIVARHAALVLDYDAMPPAEVRIWSSDVRFGAVSPFTLRTFVPRPGDRGRFVPLAQWHPDRPVTIHSVRIELPKGGGPACLRRVRLVEY